MVLNSAAVNGAGVLKRELLLVPGRLRYRVQLLGRVASAGVSQRARRCVSQRAKGARDPGQSTDALGPGSLRCRR